MTDKLPPNLLALFAPRPPLRWVKPIDHPPQARRTKAITGTGHYLEALKEYKENDTFTPTESWLEARDRKKVEKKEAIRELVQGAPEKCWWPRRCCQSPQTDCPRSQTRRRPKHSWPCALYHGRCPFELRS